MRLSRRNTGWRWSGAACKVKGRAVTLVLVGLCSAFAIEEGVKKTVLPSERCELSCVILGH